MSVHFIIRKINRLSLNPCHAHFILICIESIFKTRYVHIDGPNLLMNTKKSQQIRVTKWNKISRIRMANMKRIFLARKEIIFLIYLRLTSYIRIEHRPYGDYKWSRSIPSDPLFHGPRCTAGMFHFPLQSLRYLTRYTRT